MARFTTATTTASRIQLTAVGQGLSAAISCATVSTLDGIVSGNLDLGDILETAAFAGINLNIDPWSIRPARRLKQSIFDKIDDKIANTEHVPLPVSIAKTFKDSEYATAKTTMDTAIYRKFGGREKQMADLQELNEIWDEMKQRCTRNETAPSLKR